MDTITTDLLNAIKAYSCQLNPTMLTNQARLIAEREPNSYLGFALLSVLCTQVPELSVLLGKQYEEGIVVRKDQTKATMFYQRAAGSGNPNGEYALGWHYYEQEDYVRAVEHFENSLRSESLLADDLRMQAHACLGDSYSKLTSPNIARAVEHLAIAADKYHSIFSNRRLGILYCDASGHQYDIHKSIQYLSTAADSGDAIAAHQLAQVYLYGDDRDEIKPNGYLAERVLTPFARGDDEDIMYDLGVLYFYGDEDNGMKPDQQKSRYYYERAWSQHRTGTVAGNLGYLCFSLGDYNKALEFLTFADNEGNYNYSDFLGRIYLNGYSGSPNKQKAAIYYRRAFDAQKLNNFFTCQEYLGVLIDLGNYADAYDVAEYGIEEYNDIEFYYQKAWLVLHGKVYQMSLEDAANLMDEVRGFENYEKKACYELGLHYQNVGRYTRAIQYYTMAFDMGMSDAGVSIARIYERGGGSVQKSTVQASRWYAKAKEAGSSYK